MTENDNQKKFSFDDPALLEMLEKSRLNRVAEASREEAEENIFDSLPDYDPEELLGCEDVDIYDGLDLPDDDDDDDIYPDDDDADWYPDESEFAGTYAHDVAGFDDDAIYDAFDGDPDAYWNID